MSRRVLDSKAAYFNALREAAPELINIATGREVRPPELDTMAEVFAVTGEKQEQGKRLANYTVRWGCSDGYKNDDRNGESRNRSGVVSNLLPGSSYHRNK
jgi:streptomycin 6-kinase